MKRFEVHCHTERFLVVDAKDEASARELAEQTEFSRWDSVDSPHSIRRVGKERKTPGQSPGHDCKPKEEVSSPTSRARWAEYGLNIDGPLLRRQRALLLTIIDAVAHQRPFTSRGPGDDALLEGIAALLDEIADQAHGRYGIDCLLDAFPGAAGDPMGQSRCECELPGEFCSGVPGILAHLEDGVLATGATVERCDLCRRFPSDKAAWERLVQLGIASAKSQRPSD